jgi:hypothetical protein
MKNLTPPQRTLVKTGVAIITTIFVLFGIIFLQLNADSRISGLQTKVDHQTQVINHFVTQTQTVYKTGPEGPRGQRGATGKTGVRGLQGATGAPGKTGNVGPRGFSGSTGQKGSQGLRGPAGPQGSQGIQGIQGIPGIISTTVTNEISQLEAEVTALEKLLHVSL